MPLRCSSSHYRKNICWNRDLSRLLVKSKQFTIPSWCGSYFNSRYWFCSNRKLELNPSCRTPPTSRTTTTAKEPTIPSRKQKNDHLYVSGGAYLIPTLRLGRKDTPQSVDSLLKQILELDPSSSTANNNRHHPIQSLLGRNRQQQQSTETALGGKAKSWMVPITLDLSELLPDGSPHHCTPISLETLQNYVHVLLKYHIAVVGMVHVPHNDNHPMNLVEHLAATLGIPTLLPIHRRVAATATTTTSSKLTITGGDSIALQDLAQWIACSIIQYNHTVHNDSVTGDIGNANTVSTSSHTTREDSDDGDVTEAVNTRRSIQQALHSSIVRRAEQSGSVNIQDLHMNTSTPKNDLQPKQKQQQQGSSTNKDAPSAATSTPSSSKVVYGHVRSGQLVSSDNPHQSLVIIGDVHSGGEVLSDGDIHIYGKLQGRAIAGLLTSEARIYVRHFDPELICIHGIYTTIDNVSLIPCAVSTTTDTSGSRAVTSDDASSSFLKPGDAVIVSLSSSLKQLQYKRM